MSDAATTTPERAKKPGFIYWLGRFALTPLVRLYYRPAVVGRHNVPKTGRVIFASNHLSFVDSVAIPVCAPRPVQFLAKSSYFTGRGPKGWLVRNFFTAIGAVGVDRGAGHAAQAALDKGRDILEADSAFAIYPEGTRSLDGRLYKGRTGVAWLALTTGATVVPVGLSGTSAMMPVGAKMPKRSKVSVSFGTPIDVSTFGSATSGRARRQATDAIMAAIHDLTGQELAHAYNEAPPATPVEKIKAAVLRPERL
ncbi:lysophospholipid acyltransferase family protein [Paramicrobacterium agarici]|uniref:1-acyl-sn-glycerol-3-phosphate acyltransferase n=1 Tax=Paramicrobacterium agarici TaxID=630514 RepID=A0A2A9DY91_9MICO|nr:lysophospholipid acyltransferase family protein [Microbacterium agarici]PFG30952.1 1-acyl-sn-glycerol-3-phosphate acyltransferase [Microbacterium agarici]TQO24016.1 1-acyl-sn-glycerol-3-phosphate acyltransferase [Microbacterium agarici]